MGMVKSEVGRQYGCKVTQFRIMDWWSENENLVMIMYLSTSGGGSNTNLLKVGKVQDLLESKEDVMNDDEAGLVMLNY